MIIWHEHFRSSVKIRGCTFRGEEHADALNRAIDLFAPTEEAKATLIAAIDDGVELVEFGCGAGAEPVSDRWRTETYKRELKENGRA